MANKWEDLSEEEQKEIQEKIKKQREEEFLDWLHKQEKKKNGN